MNKNEYKEAVNKIVISDELREKIMQNSSEKKTYKYKRNNIYKHFQKTAGIAACFAFCMLSYYAITNYYHFPIDVSVNTTPPPIQTPDNSNNSDTRDNNTASVIPDTDNVQNNTNISDKQHSPNNKSRTATPVTSPAYDITNNSVKAENSASTGTDNFANADNALPISNQDAQSNSFDTNYIEQEDFPPMLGMSPSTDNNIQKENIVGNKNAGGECAGYLDENMLSVAEIEQKLGYDIKVPNYLPDDYKMDSLSAPFGEFAQIIYTNETDTLYYRTAKGSEDISGDYNVYSEIETVVINNNDVTIKGNDNLYHNASWFAGDEAFSIYSNNGMEKDTMIDIIKSVD